MAPFHSMYVWPPSWLSVLDAIANVAVMSVQRAPTGPLGRLKLSSIAVRGKAIGSATVIATSAVSAPPQLLTSLSLTL